VLLQCGLLPWGVAHVAGRGIEADELRCECDKIVAAAIDLVHDAPLALVETHCAAKRTGAYVAWPSGEQGVLAVRRAVGRASAIVAAALVVTIGVFAVVVSPDCDAVNSGWGELAEALPYAFGLAVFLSVASRLGQWPLSLAKLLVALAAAALVGFAGFLVLALPWASHCLE
jgi:hypothetical protein